MIKELNKFDIEIDYIVRDKPVLNDVTLKEAGYIGIDKFCNVMSSGCECPGLILENADKDFIEHYEKADIIISKGQGNLEGLSGVKDNIFYLLQAKCDLIADILKVDTGDLVFVSNINHSE